MKIVLISDTHGNHGRLNIPECDIIIHAGDYTNWGTIPEVAGFLAWFKDTPARYKVFINGNHEVDFHDNKGLYLGLIPEGVTYLENTSVTIEGIKIWGSPYCLPFYEHVWRYMIPEEGLAPIWRSIPNDTDIVVTHTPAFGRVDELATEGRVKFLGSKTLAGRLAIVQPRLHVCGHIHQAYGQVERNGTVHVNAAICGRSGLNKPIEYEFRKDSPRILTA